MRQYIADVKRTYRLRTVVEADSLEEAKQKARRVARYHDFSGASIERRVVNVSEINEGKENT